MDLKYRMPPVDIGIEGTKRIHMEMPILEGGRAVRLGGAHSSSGTAREGALGVFGASGMDVPEAVETNQLAKQLAKGKPVGVNLMRPMRLFPEVAQALLADGISVLVVSASVTRDFFTWANEVGTPVIPVVSKLKAVKTVVRLGASAVTVEFESGGHQGEYPEGDPFLLVEEFIKEAEGIPVFLGGGIQTGADIYRAIQAGVAGVQMGSCMAQSIEVLEDGVSPVWQEMILSTTSRDDFVKIMSPVGMPFWARRSPMTDKYEAEGVFHGPNGPGCPRNCLAEGYCGYKKSGFTERFCIYTALEEGRKGNREFGTFTSNPEAHRIVGPMRIRDRFEQLAIEYNEAATAAESSV